MVSPKADPETRIWSKQFIWEEIPGNTGNGVGELGIESKQEMCTFSIKWHLGLIPPPTPARGIIEGSVEHAFELFQMVIDEARVFYPPGIPLV